MAGRSAKLHCCSHVGVLADDGLERAAAAAKVSPAFVLTDAGESMRDIAWTLFLSS
jgi:hypothetical protein